MDSDLTAVGSGYAGAFLPSVLKCKKAEKGDAGDIFCVGVYPKNPAFFVRACIDTGISTVV